MIGLLHSNENGVAYGDSTDYMAAGHKEQDWPRKCFNGYKNWQLGWYKDRLLTLDTAFEEGHLVALAAFVDFSRTDSDEPVVINVINELFVQFNLARDFNIDTEEKRNEVTITAPGDNGSEGLVGLKEKESYRVPNFQATSKDLIIEVCTRHRGKLGAYSMWISIALEKSLCDEVKEEQVVKEYSDVDISDYPSIAPTRQPVTLKPSPLPTTMPSNIPSRFPTYIPTGNPTSVPTMTIPSTAPSHQPSHIASQQPSIMPSYDPTDKPSLSPRKRITIATPAPSKASVTIATSAPSKGSTRVKLPPMTTVPTPEPKINYKKLLEKREKEIGSVKLDDLKSLFNRGANR
jgi:hypothetical protein